MRRGLLIGCLIIIGGLAGAGSAQAYFGTSGAGSGPAAVGALSPPGSPTAVVSGSTVTISWTAASVNGSAPAASYQVERWDTMGDDLGPAYCGSVSSSAGTPNALGSFSCVDYPGPGTFEYVITAAYGQSWTSTAITGQVTVTVGTTTTTAAPATAGTGNAIPTSAVTASLSGATSSATGTLTFEVFGPRTTAPTNCSSGGTVVGTASVSGPGSYTASASFTPSSSGTYWWYSAYSGDANNAPSASTCGSKMASTVVRYVTSATISAPSSDVAGTAIAKTQITSVLSGAASNATGSMVFTVFGPSTSPPTSCSSGGTRVGSVAVSGDNMYTSSAGYTPTVAGTYWWYASYTGDPSNDLASNSGCGTGMASLTVSPATPTVTMKATSGIKTGVATSKNAYAVLASSSGSGATGTITFTVVGPQSSAPTSCSGGTTMGTVSVAGNGTYYLNGVSFSNPGTYWWYASYSGDANNSAQTSSCGATGTSTVVSNYSPTLSMTNLTSAPATDTVKTAIAASSLQATLANASSTAGGTVTYSVFGPSSSPSSCTSGGTTVGTASVSGNGTYSPSAGFTPTAPGDYWWYAGYGGDATDNAANSACNSGMAETVAWNPTAVSTGSSQAASAASAPSVTLAPYTTYVVCVSGAAVASSTPTMSTTGFSSAPTLTSITSQSFSGSSGTDVDAAYRYTTGASPPSGSGTLTATFTGATSTGESVQIAVLAVAGDPTAAPSVLTSNVAAVDGNSTSATATLPNATAALDASIVMLSGDATLGPSAPTASGFSLVPTSAGGQAYSSSAAGSLGVYEAIPGQQAASFSAVASQGWGTIAFELKHS